MISKCTTKKKNRINPKVLWLLEGQKKIENSYQVSLFASWTESGVLATISLAPSEEKNTFQKAEGWVPDPPLVHSFLSNRNFIILKNDSPACEIFRELLALR